MSKHSKEIQAAVLSFINKYKDSQTEHYDSEFNQLAMQVFAYQFQNNTSYKKFAQLRNKNMLTVKNWWDLPLMPIQAYKELTLATENTSQAADVFYSSGTTNINHRSRHYISKLNIWEESMRAGFKKYVLPNMDKIRILSLFPGMTDNPNSSLSRYISTAIREFGTEDSHIFFEDNQFDYSGLIQALKEAQQNQEPILLLGASFSYVHLLAYLQQHHQSFELAKDSIIFDTGGFKGKSKEITMDKLYTDLGRAFKISRAQIINMYGMTEISSQCYDRNLLDHAENKIIHFDKVTPSWVKTQVLDTETLQPVVQGQRGLLAYYDLANWDSCVAILTEDIVIESHDGFKIIGRAKGAVAKGCSITADELLQLE